jgi:hypothetical protein
MIDRDRLYLEDIAECIERIENMRNRDATIF